ncbi:group II intron reverse transcriptase/maturase [Lysinibacillus antri]|uniref:Group II intron reverse transcriptase/maturase n=1 Tax=Lysinibacillus antri TaxID=2498145 RepID=A0A3S0RKA9_9BACI|nr:group II intron reverse transcriptase/maturase [Lysinibacillus antri]
MTETAKATKVLKRQALRNSEYYDFQAQLDQLYLESKKNRKFTKLYELITARENILLAYRNIKKNKGSFTPGVNQTTILSLAEKEIDQLIRYVRKRLQNYQPQRIRRKEIPKPNGGIRPLGIPTIEDRIIQQCIKQILEPICEAKFHPHSYGFRPNRGTLHAYSRAVTLANKNKLHYVVDIDIKGFFDNVHHGKLLKQMWHLGIQDKRVLSIVSKLLKAEIAGVGTPAKGTPQGGILSPLLSNIVLNELDWWISSQWETFETKKNYDRKRIISGKMRLDKTWKYRMLRTSNLKEMFIVRYADDFKIFCRNHRDAFKIFEAVKKWLKERLQLEISQEKSKVINLRKNYSQFLGFKLKVVPKGKKQVVKSHMSEQAKQKALVKIKEHIQKVKKNPIATEVSKFNATILGLQNFYQQATMVSKDFSEIAFTVKRTLYNSLWKASTSKGELSKYYRAHYKDYLNKKAVFVAGVAIFPIDGVKHKNPKNFTQEINNYTEEGRSLIHKTVKTTSQEVIRYLMKNPVQNRSIEYNDNRISRYIAQQGRCAVTGRTLELFDMELHHIIPTQFGGTDRYNNLTFILKDVHKLIHATLSETILKYLQKLKLSETEICKVNELRAKAGNEMIS